MMQLIRLTELTVRWLATDYEAVARDAAHGLVAHLEGTGNTIGQIEHWMNYAAEITAIEDETLELVIETEAIMARMQGRIL